MGNWVLEILEISETGLTIMPPLHPVKRRLMRLSLNHNKISVVPSTYFKGFDNIIELKLEHNTLHTFPDVTLISHTLRDLSLIDNLIQIIPRNIYLTPFNHLQTLILNKNQISSIDYKSILAWPNLTHVVLSFNKIRSFPDTSYKHGDCPDDFSWKCFLYLNENPLDCDSRLASLIKQNISLGDSCIKWGCPLTIRSIMRCASPAHLCGRMISDLSKSSFPCIIIPWRSICYIESICSLRVVVWQASVRHFGILEAIYTHLYWFHP